MDLSGGLDLDWTLFGPLSCLTIALARDRLAFLDVVALRQQLIFPYQEAPRFKRQFSQIYKHSSPRFKGSKFGGNGLRGAAMDQK
jgi:hypothetical protein